MFLFQEQVDGWDSTRAAYIKEPLLILAYIRGYNLDRKEFIEAGSKYLHVAARYGETEAMQVLLEAGALVDECDEVLTRRVFMAADCFVAWT